jgi:hypothetical protein
VNESAPGQNVSHGDHHDDIPKASIEESNNILVSIGKSSLKYHTEPRSYKLQKGGENYLTCNLFFVRRILKNSNFITVYLSH